MKKIFLLFVVLLVACLDEDSMDSTVKIYYIPIGVETYVPITEENIEAMATTTKTVDFSNKHIQKLLRIIELSGGGDVDLKKLRVKIYLSPDKVFYIDNNGGIHSTEFESKKIHADEFDTFTQVMKKIVN